MATGISVTQVPCSSISKPSQGLSGAVSGCYGDEPHPVAPSPDLPALWSSVSPGTAARPVLSDSCCRSVYTKSLLSISPPCLQDPRKPERHRHHLRSCPHPSTEEPRPEGPFCRRELREGLGGALVGLGPSLLFLGPPSSSLGWWGVGGIISISLERCKVSLILFFPSLNPFLT